MTNQCEHGQLGRACLLREMRDENERLAREVLSRNQRALDGDKAVARFDEIHSENEALRAQVERWEKTADNVSEYWTSLVAELQTKLADCQAEAEGLRADAEYGLECRKEIAAYPCELRDFGGCGPVVLCEPCEQRQILKARES